MDLIKVYGVDPIQCQYGRRLQSCKQFYIFAVMEDCLHVTTGSLDTACFSGLKYDEKDTELCVSNLLASGYKRLVLDIYWDINRLSWSLCPVSFPKAMQSQALTSSSVALPNATSSASLSLAQVHTSTLLSTTSLILPLSSTLSTSKLSIRQDQSNLSAPLSSLGSNATKTSSYSSAEPSISSVPDSSDEPLYQLGPFQCTQTADFTAFLTLLFNYIEKTENTIDATVIVLSLNLHVAASSASPTQPAPEPAFSALPGSSSFLGNLLNINLKNVIYGPSQLSSDRGDLNSSWYSVSPSRQPIAQYYTTKTAGLVESTSDGWPSESYLEISKAKRLLVEFSNIDPQLAGYNFSADSGTIFSSDELATSRNVLVNGDGNIVKGCVFDSAISGLDQANSSWATASDFDGIDYPNSPTSSLDPLLVSISNLTSCGISAVINQTLANATADLNITAYQAASYSSIWSWAPGEPRNSSKDDSDNSDVSQFRCAIMDPDLNGRWRVEDCTRKFYAACRVLSQPYRWQISDRTETFAYASAACPLNGTFAAPRTGLENLYLHSSLGGRTDVLNDAISKGVWVDFNSLDVEACWVTGGPNVVCPYYQDAAASQRRSVLVPTIAAVIVIFLAALTLLVKCNQNRRSSKNRRTENGWDYEGVPS